MKRFLVLFLVIFVLLGGMIMADSKINADLQKKMNEVRASEKIPVLIYFEGLPSYDEVANEYRFLGEEEIIQTQVVRVLKEKAESIHYWLKQLCESDRMIHKASNFRSIWIANAVAMDATPDAILEVAGQPNVKAIVLDEPVPMLVEDRALDWGVEKINANQVWPNYDGNGVVVAVIDTGTNEHEDLKTRVRDGKNYIDANKPPRDDHSHGTHCAGTIAGNGAMGTQTGVAPKATTVAVKVLGANGSGQWSNLYQAIGQIMQGQDKVKVISMSLGGKPDEATRQELRRSCQTVIKLGVIPVIAAGNSGSSAGTVGSPGDVPEIISVGATDKNDVIASFSSRGPVTWDGVSMIKPDVSAPGVNINSCRHDSNGYRLMSGTSMATPHVAGVVALMVQANPKLNTEQAKEILEKTAVDLGTPGKDNAYGSGRVNALAAVNAAKSLTQTARGDRWEMVVKELTFNATVDANGKLFITQSIENDLLPATVTIWVDMAEEAARHGVYSVSFTLKGPNGEKTGTATVDFDNIPTDPNKYDAKYGFNCGNFDLVKGTYTGTVTSLEPNPKVKNVNVTLKGKATWPARPKD